MKYIYLKNLKKFNVLRLNKFLIDNINLSFFIVYLDYNTISLYREFFFVNKFIFNIFFNFSFKKFKLDKYWNFWGTDYYACFFNNNDFIFQIDFILKNKTIIDDYVFNGCFFNIEVLNNETIFFFDSLLFFIEFIFFLFLEDIYMTIIKFFLFFDNNFVKNVV